MEASVKVPRTFTDLSLDHLKIMFNDRISPRRRACVEKKYDLLKYVWKESQIDDCYLEKYKVNNIDEISRHDDAFSRHLLESTNRIYTGQNEYGEFRSRFFLDLIISTYNQFIHEGVTAVSF